MKYVDFHPPTFRHSIALWFFSFFPSIRMVALCNSRAMDTHSENSDIDLFVVAKPGQIWTARFVMICITAILGIRIQNPHGLKKGSKEYIQRTKNKFCLSFFITEDAMNLESIRIENDLYLDAWTQALVPLINKDKTLERFSAANSKEKTSTIHSSLFIRHSIIERLIKKVWLPGTLQTYEKL